MNCQINSVFSQRFLNFLDEHAFRSDFGEGHIGDFVAGGVDDLDFSFVPTFSQATCDVVGLPERQLRSAGADSQSQALPPSSCVSSADSLSMEALGC